MNHSVSHLRRSAEVRFAEVVDLHEPLLIVTYYRAQSRSSERRMNIFDISIILNCVINYGFQEELKRSFAELNLVTLSCIRLRVLGFVGDSNLEFLRMLLEIQTLNDERNV